MVYLSKILRKLLLYSTTLQLGYTFASLGHTIRLKPKVYNRPRGQPQSSTLQVSPFGSRKASFSLKKTLKGIRFIYSLETHNCLFQWFGIKNYSILYITIFKTCLKPKFFFFSLCQTLSFGELWLLEEDDGEDRMRFSPSLASSELVKT